MLLMKNKFYLLFIFTLFLLASCVPGLLTDEGRKGLPLITDFSILDTSTEEGECGDSTSRNFEDVFINKDLITCLDACSENQHAANEEELTSFFEVKKSEGMSDEDIENLE